MTTHPLLVAEKKKLNAMQNKAFIMFLFCFKVYLVFFACMLGAMSKKQQINTSVVVTKTK